MAPRMMALSSLVGTRLRRSSPMAVTSRSSSSRPMLSQRGDDDDGRPGGEAQAADDRVAELVEVPGVLDEVPLVGADDEAGGFVERDADDVQVLRPQPHRGVEDDDGDVGALDGALGAHDAVVLDRAVDAAGAADAGGVDQRHLLAVVLEGRVDGVARRAGDVADDDALLAEDGVGERRLADVGPADDGDAQALRGFGLLVVRVRQIRAACLRSMSSSSPTPAPLSALTGCGSPRPSS